MIIEWLGFRQPSSAGMRNLDRSSSSSPSSQPTPRPPRREESLLTYESTTISTRGCRPLSSKSSTSITTVPDSIVGGAGRREDGPVNAENVGLCHRRSIPRVNSGRFGERDQAAAFSGSDIHLEGVKTDQSSSANASQVEMIRLSCSRRVVRRACTVRLVRVIMSW